MKFKLLKLENIQFIVFFSSRAIIEELTELKLNQEMLPLHKSMVAEIKDRNLRGSCSQNWIEHIVQYCPFVYSTESFAIRILRDSFVGELGYEIHTENEHCVSVYNKIISIGSNYGLREAGFRALYSLGCEKGCHTIQLMKIG